jgi:hypothetical protein
MSAQKNSVVKSSLMSLVDAPRFLFVSSMLLFTCDVSLCFASRMSPLTLRDGFLVLAALAGLRALFRAWLRPGMLRAISLLQAGREASIDNVLAPPDGFLDALICNIFASLIVSASMFVGALPGVAGMLIAAHYHKRDLIMPLFFFAGGGALAAYLYAWLGVRYAEHAVALEGLGPFKALNRAWTTARGRRMHLLRIQLFATTLEIAGMAWGAAAFGIGLFLGIPAARLAGDYAHVATWREIRSGKGGTVSQLPTTTPAETRAIAA